MKHLASHSYGPSFDFSLYTCVTRKEAPSFKSIFMLFGSVEKPFLSVLALAAEKMASMLCHFFDDSDRFCHFPSLKILSVTLPYFLNKIQNLSHGSTRPVSHWFLFASPGSAPSDLPQASFTAD